MDFNLIVRELGNRGFIILDRPKSEKEVLDIANTLGNVVPDNNGNIVQSLQAKPSGSGIFGSFSYKVGLKEFPWHTDTSFWDIPVRWLLLSSETPTDCTTNYVQIEKILDDKEKFNYLAQKSIFKMCLPSSVLLTSFLFIRNGMVGYRYDQHLMVPYNKASIELDKWIKEKLKENKYDKIKWTGNNIAIIDNWKGIHNRADCTLHPERKLIRIYIK